METKLVYGLRFFPRFPDSLQIDINHSLIAEKIKNFVQISDDEEDWKDPLTSLGKKLSKGLLKVEGLEKSGFTAYSINLTKGRIFEWEKIFPLIINCLEVYLGGEDKVKLERLPDIFNDGEEPLLRRNYTATNDDEDYDDEEDDDEDDEPPPIAPPQS